MLSWAKDKIVSAAHAGVLVGYYLCFFFQAEDGIRDVAVTGVQTCALPISNAYGERHAIRGWNACGMGLCALGQPRYFRFYSRADLHCSCSAESCAGLANPGIHSRDGNTDGSIVWAGSSVACDSRRSQHGPPAWLSHIGKRN